MTTRIVFLALLLASVVAACRAPAGDGSSPASAEPDRPSAPVAPAIETNHPDAESPILPPTSPGPVAPAIETDHPDAEQPIPPPSQPD
jgi:hypothetical protein